MLQIQIQRESCRSFTVCTRMRRESRQHPRHPPRIFVELRKLLPQEVLFIADDGKINREEHNDKHNAEPPTARGDAESQPHQQRSQIERIARISIRTRSGERLVLAHMPRSE